MAYAVLAGQYRSRAAGERTQGGPGLANAVRNPDSREGRGERALLGSLCHDLDLSHIETVV